jgi:HD-like signal output (HDOD) protein
VAGLAKRISKLEGQEPKAAEEAFTAGMLHDLGKLVLAVNMPKEYTEATRMANSGLELPLAELQLFGANHADVGGYLIGLWGLPVPVVEAVALHHSPSRATQQTFSPLASLHAANALESERCYSGTGAPAAELDAKYLEHIGVSSHLAGWRELVENN